MKSHNIELMQAHVTTALKAIGIEVDAEDMVDTKAFIETYQNLTCKQKKPDKNKEC